MVAKPSIQCSKHKNIICISFWQSMFPAFSKMHVFLIDIKKQRVVLIVIVLLILLMFTQLNQFSGMYTLIIIVRAAYAKIIKRGIVITTTIEKKQGRGFTQNKGAEGEGPATIRLAQARRPCARRDHEGDRIRRRSGREKDEEGGFSKRIKPENHSQRLENYYVNNAGECPKPKKGKRNEKLIVP